MAAVGFRLEGVPEMEAMFRELDEELATNVIADWALAGAEQVALSARARAPRDFSARRRRRGQHLADSIHAELLTREVGFAEAGAGPDRGVFYAHIVERGARAHEVGDVGGGVHPGARAQPFMEPAFDQNVEDIKDDLAARLRAAVESARAG